MDLIIDVVGLDEAEIARELADAPSVKMIHSTGVLGGDPVITAVVHEVFQQLPAIFSSLAAVLVAWQRGAKLRRVVLKKGPKSVTLDIRGMSGEDLERVLNSRMTEFGDDKPG
jgi:hypothetical protein